MAVLQVRVQPGAKRTGFAGWYGEMAKLTVSAPPVDGAANDAVVAALAELFGVRVLHVRLVGGWHSRSKRIEIDGLTDGELTDRLHELNPR